MAPPVGTLRVGRYFLALLAIVAVLYMIVFWPGQRHTPKLGLDLVGGTQVIFTAKTDNGGTPSSSSMEQARQIMEERVNGTGVTEATVIIQGSNQLVVSIPGEERHRHPESRRRGPAELPRPGRTGHAGRLHAGHDADRAARAPRRPPRVVEPRRRRSPAQQPPSDRSRAAPSTTGHDRRRPVLRAPARRPRRAPHPAQPAPRPRLRRRPRPLRARPPCSANSVADRREGRQVHRPARRHRVRQADHRPSRPSSRPAWPGSTARSGQTEKDMPDSYFVACDGSGPGVPARSGHRRRQGDRHRVRGRAERLRRHPGLDGRSRSQGLRQHLRPGRVGEVHVQAQHQRAGLVTPRPARPRAGGPARRAPTTSLSRWTAW